MGEAHLKVWQLLPEMQQNWLWDCASDRIGWWWWLERKEVRDEKLLFRLCLLSDEAWSLHCLFSFWSRDLHSYPSSGAISTVGEDSPLCSLLGSPQCLDVRFKIPQAVFPPKLCCCWHVGLKQIWKLAALSWLPERVYQIGSCCTVHSSRQVFWKGWSYVRFFLYARAKHLILDTAISV